MPRLADLTRLALLLGLTGSLWTAPPALADVATGDSDASEEDEDDKGCATVVAPVSVVSLAFGAGLVALQRRRQD